MSFPDFTDIPLDLRPWLKQAPPVFLRQYRSAIPEISGNKSFKLSGWLNVHRPGQTLVSFGGAYSNHLLALAAAAPHTVGIIRGEAPTVYNPWLARMRALGMRLEFVSRSAFRDKSRLQHDFEEKYPNALWIPEGGGGLPGIAGARHMALQTESYGTLVLASGTGTSAAGIALQARHAQVWGIQVLKGEMYVQREMEHLLGDRMPPNVVFDTRFHFGGYARYPLSLAQFHEQWQQHSGIALDRVYGIKALFGLIERLRESPQQQPVLLYHTGGLGPLNPSPGG